MIMSITPPTTDDVKRESELVNSKKVAKDAEKYQKEEILRLKYCENSFMPDFQKRYVGASDIIKQNQLIRMFDLSIYDDDFKFNCGDLVQSYMESRKLEKTETSVEPARADFVRFGSSQFEFKKYTDGY